MQPCWQAGSRRFSLMLQVHWSDALRLAASYCPARCCNSCSTASLLPQTATATAGTDCACCQDGPTACRRAGLARAFAVLQAAGARYIVRIGSSSGCQSDWIWLRTSGVRQGR